MSSHALHCQVCSTPIAGPLQCVSLRSTWKSGQPMVVDVHMPGSSHADYVREVVGCWNAFEQRRMVQELQCGTSGVSDSLWSTVTCGITVIVGYTKGS